MVEEIEDDGRVDVGESEETAEPIVSEAVADPKEDMNPATRLVPFTDPNPVSDQSITIIEKSSDQRSTVPSDESKLRDHSQSDEFEIVQNGYLQKNRCFGEKAMITRAEILAQNRSPRDWCERGELIPAEGVNP